MQPKTKRSPWFQMTKALLGTSAQLPSTMSARPNSGWRQFGLEVSAQIQRYLEEFYDFPPPDANQPDELTPLVRQFHMLASGPTEPLLAWVDQHLPAVLDTADAKGRKEFAAGLTSTP